MQLGKFFECGANIQLFYIEYTGKNDGLFITPKLSLSATPISLSLFFQATQAIASNIEPFPDFEWNVGITYTF